MANNYTVFVVLLSTTLLAITSAVLGLTLVLQKESLLGDALAHAALPGVVIAFLLRGEKVTGLLLLGGAISGLLAIWLIRFIHKQTKLPFDSVLSVILASFFGLGMVLLTYTQRLPHAAAAGLKQFIFGQAAAIIWTDVLIIIGVSVMVLLFYVIRWEALKLYIFDMQFAQSSGINGTRMKRELAVFIILVVLASLQSVGVVLTSAMLIAPGIAALQWGRKFGVVVLLAAVFAAGAAVIGTGVSMSFSNVPTGPAIVVMMSVFAIFSLFYGRRYPRSGAKMRILKSKGGGVGEC